MPPPVAVSSFTIPSIHDDTPLECRIYHPAKFPANHGSGETVWRKKAAIIAHPYGPLGGSYDDPVVQSAVTEILKHGFVVGTFNFRGAGSSKGNTSWTAKPELADYISFVGFFVQYISRLRPPWIHHAFEKSQPAILTTVPLSPIQTAVTYPSHAHVDGAHKRMILILGGYSYGSLITTHLPPTEAIISHFSSVVKGTAEAEIRLRATHLSTKWNAEVQCHPYRGRSLAAHDEPRPGSHSIVVGGEESEPGTRRASRDSRGSFDIVRRSLDRSRSQLRPGRHSSESKAPPVSETVEVVDLVPPVTFYLLISPLLPPISKFATMFSKPIPFHGKTRDGGRSTTSSASLEADHNVQRCPTLAVYGDRDFFTSPKRLRKWAEQMTDAADSSFVAREIHGAGHFWHEEGVDGQMRSRIRDWVVDITGSPVPHDKH